MENIISKYPDLKNFTYIDDEIDLMSLKERTCLCIYGKGSKKLRCGFILGYPKRYNTIKIYMYGKVIDYVVNMERNEYFNKEMEIDEKELDLNKPGDFEKFLKKMFPLNSLLD